jgi:hypothetical protein
MKVKMLETVQGADVSGALPNGKTVTLLEPGGTYEVGQALGAWLLEHRKAEEVADTPTKAAGKVAVVEEPAEPKNDPDADTEPNPMMSTKSHGQEAPKRKRTK